MQLEHTVALAEEMARHLQGGEMLAMCGDLGAGKTTFTRQLTRALGCRRLANSPTFSLIQTYPGGRLPVAHCDLYRLGSAYELEELGWDELLEEHENGLVVVEWADKFPDSLPADRLTMSWVYGEDEDTRHLSMEAEGPLSEALLANLDQGWSNR